MGHDTALGPAKQQQEWLEGLILNQDQKDQVGSALGHR